MKKNLTSTQISEGTNCPRDIFLFHLFTQLMTEEVVTTPVAEEEVATEEVVEEVATEEEVAEEAVTEETAE